MESRIKILSASHCVDFQTVSVSEHTYRRSKTPDHVTAYTASAIFSVA